MSPYAYVLAAVAMFVAGGALVGPPHVAVESARSALGLALLLMAGILAGALVVVWLMDRA